MVGCSMGGIKAEELHGAVALLGGWVLCGQVIGIMKDFVYQVDDVTHASKGVLAGEGCIMDPILEP